MTVTSYLQAKSSAQLISSVIFFPLFMFFAGLVFPKRQKAIIIEPFNALTKKALAKRQKGSLKKQVEQPVPTPSDKVTETGEVLEGHGLDIDRRVFLKIVGSAGAGLFFLSIFTKKSHAAFFGSAPIPGAMTIRDSTGASIDPAIKTPTDGYKISEIDDSSPSYYGFVNKNGEWFIMKEEATGAYRYTKGDSGFSTNWAIRAGLSYGYFDSIF